MLWHGTPPRGLRLYGEFGQYVFGLFWAGFALFWNVQVWRTGDWPMMLWGLPFLFFGAYLVAGQPLADAWVRRRQRYWVTDRRVMVERLGWHGSIRSLELANLPLLAMTERVDGSGDLRFEPKEYGRGKSGRPFEKHSGAKALSPVVQFLQIPNVAAVREIVARAGAERGRPEHPPA